MSTRPPIITILGHVDHGKTSLLDAIRHTSVAASETGGITQHVGAYQVEHASNTLTFIDTPGHAAFSAMRSRGGQIADIAVLVIAADDGVMPQTKESLDHIHDSKIPFLVAITKIDLPSADTLKIKTQLAENSVQVEGFGGNIPVVEVSSKQNLNLDKLLDTLLLMAEMEDIKADPKGVLEAVVIESRLDRHKGPLTNLIVKNGTLKVSDQVVALVDPKNGKLLTGKARSLTDWKGNQLKEVLPSTPVQLLGFTKVPPVGSLITHPDTVKKIATESFLTKLDPATKGEKTSNFPVILKADVVGTLEAILGSLPPEVEVISAGSGPINESDILLALTTKSTVVGFRTPTLSSAKKLAEVDHIDIFTYQTIYDLLEDLPKLITTAEARASYELELGEIQVLKIFDIAGKQIIGARVQSGSLNLNDQLRLLKNDQSVAEAKVASLRLGRLTVDKVKKGDEFGLITDPVLVVSPKDRLIAYKVMKKE